MVISFLNEWKLICLQPYIAIAPITVKRFQLLPSNTDNFHHHHHVVLLARISLALSRLFSLSFIASGRSSGLHPVSSHSCWMYVQTGRPTFARPYAGVHRSTSLMSSSLLLQQCPVCLVRLTWIVFVMEVGGRIAGSSWGVAARICSILLAAFLCNCRYLFGHNEEVTSIAI